MTVQLKYDQFQGASEGPHLLITGAVHGDEFEPIVAIRRLKSLFRERDDSVRDFRGQLTLVPIVNESAFLRGHRCGEDGLDLARTCPGRPDGTITEQTAFALSELIRQATHYIDLHTGGTELSVFPLSGYCLHQDENVLAVQRRMAKAFNLPVIWGTDPTLQGRSLSVARDAMVPAIYAEYLGAATCCPEGVDAYVNGCLNVMSELGMLNRHMPENRVQHVVENSTPQSGHMQICNPSPLTGYFEACVQVGDRVEAGDLLGTVYGIDGEASAPIRSSQSGLVLVLRTFPRVRSGESVGVILEL
ncbi:MAG: succinylglutamate desuccinylase/aspartoacylase family protein [Planctomyces sp.]